MTNAFPKIEGRALSEWTALLDEVQRGHRQPRLQAWNAAPAPSGEGVGATLQRLQRENPLAAGKFYAAHREQLQAVARTGQDTPAPASRDGGDIRAAFAAIKDPRARTEFFNKHRDALFATLRPAPAK